MILVFMRCKNYYFSDDDYYSNKDERENTGYDYSGDDDIGQSCPQVDHDDNGQGGLR